MCVDDRRELDLPTFDQCCDGWKHADALLDVERDLHVCRCLLVRKCRINNDGIFGFVVGHEVGIIVGLANSCL